MNPTFSSNRIFISHSCDDHEQVLALIDSLEAASFSCWASFRDIPAGALWDKVIEKALREATAAIVFVTQSSIESNYVRAEVDDALSRNQTVIPVIAEDVELPLRWRTLQNIKWSDNSRDLAINAIIEALPQTALNSLRLALDDSGRFEKVRSLILQHAEWLPIEFAMARYYSMRPNTVILPDSPVDFFAARLDTPGPRASLYYLCSPTESPVSSSGGARPHIRKTLTKVRRHLNFLSHPIPSEHELAPTSLFAAEAHKWRMIPPRYTQFSVYLIAGRRHHYEGRALAAREAILGKANRMICQDVKFEARLDLMSYDRLLANASSGKK
ncbi:toll/interleukin-1 receptor domain-containing protein [uncultured Propionivibrio sp.]|uniref:toll/interleukin-1 receptor domain-containing protein n=1 Tax=uncultured Propionivibrio sp. TaxID=426737 RepID=UPI0029C0B1D9|nr:toll/interleukin-1 receptor domain-containing protein [uncultured Propionivibrio sp.]